MNATGEKRGPGSGRTGEHGETARETADDDVQPGAALEPDRVHDTVGKRSHENEKGREPVGRQGGRCQREQQRQDDASQPDPVGLKRPVTNGRDRVRFM